MPLQKEPGLVRAARDLRDALRDFTASPPVTHVYNPLEYAWEPHRRYLELYARGTPRILLLGMNPGPWGMCQTGVPFGDVRWVQEWLGITAPVRKPRHELPSRPVLGFDCPRAEVSGQRVWGWAARRFGSPGRFFARFFIWNYCPLCFFEADGRNRTPDRLAAADRMRLYPSCDEALRQAVSCLGSQCVIGVGKFAFERATQALSNSALTLSHVTHPSPANPRARPCWGQHLEQRLAELGLPLE